MAQLPPKIPSMAQNWPTSPHQKMTNTTIPNFMTNSNRQQQQCNNWMEELFDFTSSSRRGGHKRSMSDSIAFLHESPLSHNNGANFERFDDEQLMSMFSSEDMSVTVPPTTISSSNPSSPSDQNSNNDDIPMSLELDQLNNNNNNNNCNQQLKVEPGEVESSFEPDQPRAQPSPTNSSANLSSHADTINIDPKRVKRILANRQSAQRSRVRKLQYISELERSVTALQSEVSALSPRVAFLDHQRLILNVDNSTLKQRIAVLAQDKIFKDAHQEALKKEIERLRQIYHQQNLKKMANQNAQTPPSLSQQQHQQPPNSGTMDCTDNK